MMGWAKAKVAVAIFAVATVGSGVAAAQRGPAPQAAVPDTQRPTTAPAASLRTPTDTSAESVLLRLVADGYAANLQRIKTWTGAAVLDFVVPERGPDAQLQIRVRFAADIERSMARWEFEDGPDLKAWAGSTMAPVGMVRDGQFYELRPLSGERVRNRLVRPLAERQPDWRLDAFHPVKWMHMPVGDGFPQWLRANCDDDAMRKSLKPGEVQRKGDLVTFELREGSVVNRYVFDVSKGCGLVAYHASGSDLSEDWNLELEAVADVFVPKVIECVRIEGDGGNRVVSRRRVEFTASVLNQPIAQSVFSPALLDGKWANE